MDLEINKPRVLRFIRNSSVCGKMSTVARRANEKPEPYGLWFAFSSWEWIRTTDLRVMSDFPATKRFALKSFISA
jgi:hypothetical protein